MDAQAPKIPPPGLRVNARLIALALVVCLGAALRLYDLSSVPSELIVDELDLYNSVHSIVTTGHDVDGTLQPFLYSSFTRNPPIYGVAGYASSLVFGNTPFGLRFPAVLFGLSAIVLMYAIALELTGRRDVALVTALLQATQPIFVHFSRVAWEPASELPFLLGGLYVLLRVFRASAAPESRDWLSLRGLALAAVLLALTSYTYMAGWFYAAALGGAIVALNVRRLRTGPSFAKICAAICLWAAVSAPALWMWFADPMTIGRTQRIATFSKGISLESLQIFASNYLKHFHWSYLVTTGDPQTGVTWRYLVGFGAFYWFVIPLAAIGLALAGRYVRARWALLWVWIWLLVYPLGGALTNEGAPNAPRTLAGAPVFCLLAAIGLAVLLDLAALLKPPKRARMAALAVNGLFAVSLAVSIAVFSLRYFAQYVHVYANAWDSGTRAMFGVLRDRSTGYSRVCFSVWPAWYGIDTYVRYYLSGTPLQTIDNVTDPACSLPGTLIATDANHTSYRPGFLVIARVSDVSGLPFAVVAARPPKRAR